MRLQKKYWLTALCFLLIILGVPASFLFSEKLRALSTNHRFNRYTHTLFCTELQQNALNLHYTLARPEKQGITSYSYSLGSYDPSPSAFPLVRLENCRRRLESFPERYLSPANRLTREILLLSCSTRLQTAFSPLLEEPLSPTLGTQAQLPVLLAEYTFRREQDVADYLKILASVDDYLKNILAFEQAKSENGLFMSDATADRIIRQCADFIADPSDNYLDLLFREKLDQLPGLSKKKKQQLVDLHGRILRKQVFPAYQSLIDGLYLLKGTGKNPGGLSNFPGGKNYYEYLLKSDCGLYESVSEIQHRLLRQLQTDLEESRNILREHPEFRNSADSAPSAASEDPEKILSRLRKAIADDFPAPPDASFEVRYVHKALEAHLSPAFYLTPPIDTLTPNTIYINRYTAWEDADLFTTLAHEGFPGHLYQTLRFAASDPTQIRYLLSCGGYVEGWATYVESYASSYADSCLSQDPQLSRLQWLNRSANLCLVSLLDTGIHYDGWTRQQADEFLSLFGITDPTVQEQLFQAVVEDPANYLKYTMGYLHFQDLRDTCRKKAGETFQLKEFHQHVLETGPCPFPILEKQVLSFYSQGKEK